MPGLARVSSPDSAYSSSRWPLPETPAMPTTSPARTCSDDVVQVHAERVDSRASVEHLDVQHRRAGLAPRGAASAGGSAPIIRRLSEALDSSRGSQTPVTLPPRSTVQAVQSSRISCSLWLMYRMLQPSEASFFSTTKSFSTACGVSTEVGSSRISSCGLLSSARMISTRCISPTLRVCTGRAGVDVQAVFAGLGRRCAR